MEKNKRILSVPKLKNGKEDKFMTFYDTHMHSFLSFDSKAEPTSYISEKTEVLTFTEHLDLENTIFDKRDDIPDFAEIVKWQRKFQKEHDIELLLGVEVGYVPGQEEQLKDILSAYAFDVKLLSCHQNDQYDYMDEKTDDTPGEMMDKYVKQLFEAVSTMTECQIMTHFDYGFRVHNVSSRTFEAYKEPLKRVFEKAIENNFAFELNGKSIEKYDTLELYEWAVPTFLELGGHIFSLGSDAHDASEHFLAFDTMISLLEKHGVTEVAQYKKQEREMVSLKDVKRFLSF